MLRCSLSHPRHPLAIHPPFFCCMQHISPPLAPPLAHLTLPGRASPSPCLPCDSRGCAPLSTLRGVLAALPLGVLSTDRLAADVRAPPRCCCCSSAPDSLQQSTTQVNDERGCVDILTDAPCQHCHQRHTCMCRNSYASPQARSWTTNAAQHHARECAWVC
jgi:hypothetical protein